MLPVTLHLSESPMHHSASQFYTSSMGHSLGGGPNSPLYYSTSEHSLNRMAAALPVTTSSDLAACDPMLAHAIANTSTSPYHLFLSGGAPAAGSAFQVVNVTSAASLCSPSMSMSSSPSSSSLPSVMPFPFDIPSHEMAHPPPHHASVKLPAVIAASVRSDSPLCIAPSSSSSSSSAAATASPSSRSASPVVGSGSSSAASSRKATLAALDWLAETFEQIEAGSSSDEQLSRGEVYAEYKLRCDANSICAVHPALLGKLLRKAFPAVSVRRLGTRKASRYRYMGLKHKMGQGGGGFFSSSSSLNASSIASSSSSPNRRSSPSAKMMSAYSSIVDGLENGNGSEDDYEDEDGAAGAGAVDAELDLADLRPTKKFKSEHNPTIHNSAHFPGVMHKGARMSSPIPPGSASGRSSPSGLPLAGALNRVPLVLPPFRGNAAATTPDLQEFVCWNRLHCQELADAIVQLRFADARRLMETFWTSLPARFTAAVTTPASETFLMELLQYDRLVFASISKNMLRDDYYLRHLSAAALIEVRDFAAEFSMAMEASMSRSVPQASYYIQRRRECAAQCLIGPLVRRVSEIQLFHQATEAMTAADVLSAMREDWMVFNDEATVQSLITNIACLINGASLDVQRRCLSRFIEEVSFLFEHGRAHGLREWAYRMKAVLDEFCASERTAGEQIVSLVLQELLLSKRSFPQSLALGYYGLQSLMGYLTSYLRTAGDEDVIAAHLIPASQ